MRKNNVNDRPRIDIYLETSYDSAAIFKKITEGWACVSVDIDYDIDGIGAPFGSPSNCWPFKAVCVTPTTELEVRIFSFAIGYTGTGPNDAIDILTHLGVDFDRDDICTKRRKDSDGHIRLHYVNENIRRQ